MRWPAAHLLGFLLVWASMPAGAWSKNIVVAPGANGLVDAIAAASPGDIIDLKSGKHLGPAVIAKALTLRGEPGASVIGNGEGSVIRIESSGVTVRGLSISGSGTNSTNIDAGIYVAQHADDPIIEDNLIDGNQFGVSLHGPKRAVVRNNVIRNRNDLWLNDRGNGIHMWNNVESRIENNIVIGGRDGVFVQLGSDNAIVGNRFEHLRFAVHFMYSKRGSIEENVSVANHVGYALMYSDRLIIAGNVSAKDRDYGLMLNSARKSTVDDNVVFGAADKCLFLYLALQNKIENNRFEECGVGVHVTGSDGNLISGNAFLNNRAQMRYAGTKSYEWSVDGRGNYWSDNAAFDLNGDGAADTAYRPNDIVDWVSWRYPLSKLLMSSPAMEILRAGQGQFPALYPGGIVDSHPLMVPPPSPRPLPELPADVKWEEGKADPAS